MLAQSIYYHFQREEWGQGEEIMDQSKTRTQQGTLQMLYFSSDMKVLRWLHPSNFAVCNSLLSVGLVPLMLRSSPRQSSHPSGTSNILGSPVPSQASL